MFPNGQDDARGPESLPPARSPQGQNGRTHRTPDAPDQRASRREFPDPVPPADEDFIGRYNEIAHAGEIPNQVAFSFGNAVGYVTRPDFCPAVLIDFLRLRKFVCVTPEAFPTAQPYLEEYAKR